MPFETPIAFCIFNRPKLTEQVFRAIAKVQPRQLMIVGDGPRIDHPHDSQQVQAARQIATRVDWDCQVLTNFSDVNLGCKSRMATGLTWAFDQAEELIILEDDCLPEPSFFEFCQTLLKRYRDHEQIMMISGDNFQPHRRTQSSYYFSRWPHIWGWASWRRAWQHFDVNVSQWPADKANGLLRSTFGNDREYAHWSAILDRQHAGEIDTWDFPWAYSVWRQGGLTILPESNLITNLGFGDSATHTTDASSRLAKLATQPIGDLIHPDEIAVNFAADQYTWEHILAPPVPSSPCASKWYHRFQRRQAG